jgi:O-antigen/teichoic acid export membrane protein
MIEKIKNVTHKLLRKSEKYAKTDMVYLAKGGFWLSLSQVGTSLAAFILSLAFARFVSKDVYGTYKYILSIASIISVFALSGLGTALEQSVARGYDGALRYAFRQNIKWSSGMVILALFAAAYYGFLGNFTIAWSLLAIAIFTPLLRSSVLYDAFLTGKKDFKSDALYNTGAAVASAIVIIFVIIFFRVNPIILVFTYFISNTLANLVCYALILRKYKPTKAVDTDMLHYSRHLSAINVLNAIFDNIDQIFLFHFLGAIDLAIYSFAVALPEQLKGLFKNASILALPKFANSNYQEIRSSMKSKVLVFVIGIILATLAYIIAAPLIYKLLFPQYQSSVIYSQIFAISLVTIAATIPQTALQSHKKTSSLYFLGITSLIIQITTLLVGISYFGLMGAIIARVVTRFLNASISFAIV